MSRKILAGIIAVVMAIVVALVLVQMKQEKAVIVGAVMPLTGDAASYGIAVREGIELASEEINSQGGINGTPIKVVFEDSQGDPKQGVSAFQKLVSANRTEVVVGAVASSVTLAIAPIAERSEVVLISPASSSPKITTAGDFVFRNYPSDELEGRLVADFAMKQKLKTAAVLTINNDYGTGLNDVFSKSYQSAGGNVVMNDKFLQGTNDFRTLLAKVKQSSPQCIFIVGYGKELGTLVKQAKELNVSGQFLSTVNFYDSQSIAAGGTAVEGVIFSSPVFDSESMEPEVHHFVTRYKERYGQMPDVWAAHGYDALTLVAEAMRKKGVVASNVRDGLYEIRGFPGVSGVTTFDSNGDVVKEARFLTVKNGRFVAY